MLSYLCCKLLYWVVLAAHAHYRGTYSWLKDCYITFSLTVWICQMLCVLYGSSIQPRVPKLGCNVTFCIPVNPGLSLYLQKRWTVSRRLHYTQRVIKSVQHIPPATRHVRLWRGENNLTYLSHKRRCFCHTGWCIGPQGKPRADRWRKFWFNGWILVE